MEKPNISTPPQTNLPPKPEINPVIPSPSPKFSPPLIATFVLLLVLVGTIGFFLGKSLSQPKTSQPPISQVSPTPTPENPIPTPTPDPTANWKTYTSDQFNFQIKHPENMEVDCTNNAPNTCVVRIINSIGAPGFEEFFLTFYNKEGPTEKNPEVEKQKKLLEMKIGETKQVCQLPAPASCIYKRINDFNGLVNFRVFENYHPSEGPGDIQMILINEGKDRNTEVIFSYDNGSQRNGSLTKELFDLILSTFKFLD
jgi:hypothetical protein